MPRAQLPGNETDRLAALHDYDVLDTACEENFDTIVRLAAKLSRCPVALVSLVDTDRQWFKARHGLDATETTRDLSFCAHAILDPSKPFVIPDATKDQRFADNALVLGAPNIRFYAGIPLRTHDGYALGTLCVIDTRPREFGSEAIDTLVGLAQTVSTALELRRAMHQVRMLALTDMLTGLPNRAAFVSALAQALDRQNSGGERFSVLLLDLDGFKQINDVLGHPAGDRVLVDVAAVLRASIRNDDIAARLGGDEFGVILAGRSGSDPSLVGERIRSVIETTMAEAARAVTVSVGAITFLAPPADETEVLSATDALLYAAKASGKNRVVWRSFSGCEVIQPCV
jgi:diguanylate cyclase (GGDEF)-like protein